MKKNLLIILLIVTSFVSNAQFSQISNIYPANITEGDEFGSAVAIDGDFMAVGAYYYNDVSTAPGTGSVYMWHYDGTNWVYDSQIIPTNNPYNGDQFGNAIAISGNNMIIGAWNGSTNGDLNPGTVTFYNYDGTSWTGEMKWVCGINQYDLGYGTDVDLYGEYAIVGAPGVDNNHGRAYVYFKNSGTWEMQQNLVHSSTTQDYFGSSVAIGNNIAFVGAEGENKVYVYTYDGTNWNNTSTITPSTTGVSFGNSMSYDGTNLIIGDVGDNSAYIFTFDGTNWVEQKVTASDGSSTDHFGRSVSISGNYAIVGAWGKSSMTGASYIYENNNGTWSQSQKIIASNGNSNDRFGFSVAIQNTTAVVGAYYDNPSSMGNYAGSAYIFNMPPPPPPTITMQPQDVNVCESSDAVFSITATDASSYQWFNSLAALTDGGDISGATTNQLTIANTEIADNDDYYCIVSGDGGAVQSDNATLVVDTIELAIAGDEQFICSDTAFLSANAPVAGTGVWTITGGSGSFGNVNVNNTMVTGLSLGANNLSWTITNGACISSSNVTINNESVTASFDATPLQMTFPDATVSITNSSTDTLSSYSWDFGDGNEIIEDNFTETFEYSYLTWGTYLISLEITGFYCSDTDTQSVVILQPNLLPNTNQNISIFPNPTSDFITISGINNIAQTFIYNAEGKLLMSTKINSDNNKIDLSGLTKGVYTLKVISNKNSFTEKIILN